MYMIMAIPVALGPDGEFDLAASPTACSWLVQEEDRYRQLLEYLGAPLMEAVLSQKWWASLEKAFDTDEDMTPPMMIAGEAPPAR